MDDLARCSRILSVLSDKVGLNSDGVDGVYSYQNAKWNRFFSARLRPPFNGVKTYLIIIVIDVVTVDALH